MKAGIIGAGIVGKALAKCYKKNKIKVIIKDKDKVIMSSINFLNICIPYTKKFNSIVISYIKKIKPKYVIIHSTVPCGTADFIRRKIRCEVISSPVRGSHDNLYESLKIFLKYVGCNNTQAAVAAVKHFREIGIDCKILNSNKAAELLKLLCTTYYGICIKWHDHMFKMCQKAGINFGDITHWNLSYNAGYSKLNCKHVVRPILTPPKGKIGGTCIIPNAKLLKLFTDDKFIDILINNM